MEIYGTEQVLNNKAIAVIVNDLTKVYLNVAGKKAMAENRFKISLEEILLRFRDCYGEEVPCKIVCTKKRRKISIEISQEGLRKDWLPCDEDIKVSYDILARLNVSPRYLFSHIGKGRNRVIWEPMPETKSNSMLYYMLASVILAVFVGIIVNSVSSGLHKILVEDIISPLFEKSTAILSEFATPLVFFAVIGGIVGIGDAKSFGKIGSKVLLRMLGSYIIAALFLGIGSIFVFNITPSINGTSGETSAAGQIIQMVLDIIPDNLVVPFTTDNDLQVIAISIFIGVTLLLLGNRVSKLNDAVKDISELVNKMMSICCKGLPFLVFFGVVKIISTSNSKQFLSIGKMFVVYIAINAVFMLSMVIRATVVSKVPFKTIFPKQLATLFINITTASQVAALPENMICCKEKFGIDEKFVNFALPLGIVIYMPSGTIFLGLTVIALSSTFGIPLTIGLLIRILIVCVIVAIAAPPIPGSAVVVMPVLFATCGVPNEAFPLAIIFATIVGYVVPAFNGFNIQLELLMTAKKLNKIDDKKLREKYIKKV